MSDVLDRLTPKRRKFVLAFVGEARGNGTEAARIAGYKKPKQEASFILTNPDVSAAIGTLTAPTEARQIATMEECLEMLTSIIRGEVGEVCTDLAGSPTGEVIPAKPSDRTKAIQQLSRMCGWETKKRSNPHEGLPKSELIARLEITLRKLKEE